MHDDILEAIAASLHSIAMGIKQQTVVLEKVLRCLQDKENGDV